MNYNTEIVNLHQGIYIFVLVAKSFVLILQIRLDRLFGVLIKRLSVME
jgi:hypothetical protein